ncbi:hypothetical protein [Bacillus sp. M6-12]|uniref:hypothetical protein n=1 Tax=Bacillus sp. M6-12 TaxID=2054166 RepID=UPI0015E0CB9B|nr:hypothetical protein [Bacillus sp. M6-12]
MTGFKVIERTTGKELKGCIIVFSEHGGYDVYENEEDYKNGIDTITKNQEYYQLVMVYD